MAIIDNSDDNGNVSYINANENDAIHAISIYWIFQENFEMRTAKTKLEKKCFLTDGKINHLGALTPL